MPFAFKGKEVDYAIRLVQPKVHERYVREGCVHYTILLKRPRKKDVFATFLRQVESNGRFVDGPLERGAISGTDIPKSPSALRLLWEAAETAVVASDIEEGRKNFP